MGTYQVSANVIKNRLYISLMGFMTDAEVKVADAPF